MTTTDQSKALLREAARRAVLSGEMGPAEVVATVLTEMRVLVRRGAVHPEGDYWGDMERFLERVEEDVTAAWTIERDARFNTEG